jgi:mannosyltransferase OCH1-like enzyme
MKYRYLHLLLLALLSSIIQADIKKLYVDFDKSMGKSTRRYLKKYKKSHNKVKLDYVKKFYDKNNFKAVQCSKKVKIPCIIHQVWVGDKPLPKNYEILKKTWLTNHPGWKYNLWTNKKVAKLKLYNQKFYDQAIDPVEKANLARYEILYKYGGVYADIDFQSLKSLEPLHYCYDFYTGIEPNDSAHILNNALIGCSKHNALIKYCIESVKDDMHRESRYHRNGVGHFTRIFMEKADKVKGSIIALPPTYFYPLNVEHSLDKPVIYCLKPESLAVHLWAHEYSKRNKEYGTNMPRLEYIQ